MRVQVTWHPAFPKAQACLLPVPCLSALPFLFLSGGPSIFSILISIFPPLWEETPGLTCSIFSLCNPAAVVGQSHSGFHAVFHWYNQKQNQEVCRHLLKSHFFHIFHWGTHALGLLSKEPHKLLNPPALKSSLIYKRQFRATAEK